MTFSLLRRVTLLALAIAAGPTLAAVVTFNGNLGDTANTALVASDLNAPQFTDEYSTANNVALYSLQVPEGGSVSIASAGYASGGIDPYVTVFGGIAQTTATFLESNYLHAFSVGGDFTLALTLTPGDYTVAVGVFANQSFAENLGTGFLSDGFTGLGGPLYFGDGNYALFVTLPNTGVVPEPSTALLTCTGALMTLWVRRRRHT